MGAEQEAVGGAWLRPEAEAEGGRGTADGGLLLAGLGCSYKGGEM